LLPLWRNTFLLLLLLVHPPLVEILTLSSDRLQGQTQTEKSVAMVASLFAAIDIEPAMLRYHSELSDRVDVDLQIPD